MINKNIIVIGPLEGPITGQQFITNHTASLSQNGITVISTGGVGVSLIKFFFLWLSGFILLTKACLRRDKKFILYLSISRSWFGLLKESYIALLQLIYKFPLVIHWHGAEPRLWLEEKNKIISYIFVKTWKRAIVNIALSSRMALDLEKLGFRNTVVISNFPNIDEKNFEQINISSEIKTIKFLFLSNLIPGKGLEDVIECLSSISEKNFSLDIVGSNISSQSKQYNELINSFSFVKYHGCLEKIEKEKLLKKCDLLIFPSTYRTEAMPLVVIEAIFAGLGVVAYNHNYMVDFKIIPGVVIVEPKIDELKKVLINLCENPSLINKLKKQNFLYRQQFSKKIYDQEISRVINRLL